MCIHNEDIKLIKSREPRILEKEGMNIVQSNEVKAWEEHSFAWNIIFSINVNSLNQAKYATEALTSFSIKETAFLPKKKKF